MLELLNQDNDLIYWTWAVLSFDPSIILQSNFEVLSGMKHDT